MFRISLAIAALLAVAAAAASTQPATSTNDGGDWKRGRVYYRMTCTACHKDMAEKISPMSRSIAEWKAYFAADRHDASGRTNPSVAWYTSRAYRESVRTTNKAADKFIDVPDDELLSDVRAFAVHGARDSDTPARCN